MRNHIDRPNNHTDRLNNCTGRLNNCTGRFRLPLPIFLFLLLALPLCQGCGGKADPIEKSGFYFDTIITITLYDEAYEPLLEDCFDLAETYESYFSATAEDSDVARINRAQGAAVEVHEETAELIEKGLSYGKLSGGGFDITIGALSSLWDFSGESSEAPADEDIQDALSTVGYENVVIQGNFISLKNPDARIDLGGIAKGYIADRMKAYLNEHGVTAGLINLGGNVLCVGPKPGGGSYRIGIQKPFDEEGSAIASVDLEDETAVTSGVYERYFMDGDRLCHHLLDPSTGYPFDNGLYGVTVICQDSVDGDGLSTACFSLGLGQGMELVESLPDTEAIFITDDGEIHSSSGIGSKIPFREY